MYASTFSCPAKISKFSEIFIQLYLTSLTS
jgi:hypothetical protein